MPYQRLGRTCLTDRSFSRPYGIRYRGLKLPKVSAALECFLLAASNGFAAGGPDTVGLTIHRPLPDNLPGVIPEIDIWRVAYLMLKRYGDEADIESAIRAEELAEATIGLAPDY